MSRLGWSMMILIFTWIICVVIGAYATITYGQTHLIPDQIFIWQSYMWDAIATLPIIWQILYWTSFSITLLAAFYIAFVYMIWVD